MLQAYGEFRREADRLLGELAALADAARQPAVAAGARQRRERLRANEFHVAVVSEFSNGKSTLLNALLGIDLLPTHRRPLTATVVRIAHGTELEVLISFKDGRKAAATPRDADLRRLLNHFTTSLTSAASEVEEVLIRHPLPLLAHGLVLLDTPGLESVYDLHDRLTRQVLPQADAVIFVVEAGKIGRLADLKLVRHLRFLRQEAIFFVLNKVDQLRSPGEVAEAVRELADMLRGAVDAPRIYPVSALYALQARLLRSGRATPQDLARDRRLAVPDGEGFRPVRDAGDAAALEAASGLAALERDLEAYLLSDERIQDALKGAAVHVAGRITDAVLPDLRRLRAALEGTEPADKLLSRLASCRAELAAARASLEALLAPDGRLARAGAEIWSWAVERRLTPAALERLVTALEKAADADTAAVWSSLDYALRRLCADAAEDLKRRWSLIARDLAGMAEAEIRAALARVDEHLGLGDPPPPPPPPPPPAPAGLARPGALLAAALGGLLNPAARAARARLREEAGTAVARGRRLLADLNARYERALRERLAEDYRETVAALEQTLARLEEDLVDRERLAGRLAELTALERRAHALLEEAKSLLARLERAQAPSDAPARPEAGAQAASR